MRLKTYEAVKQNIFVTRVGKEVFVCLLFFCLFLPFSNQRIFAGKYEIYLHAAIYVFPLSISKLNEQSSVNSSGTNIVYIHISIIDRNSIK